MKHHRTEEEIEIQRNCCLLVSETLAEVAKMLRPGITTQAVDHMAESFIRDHHGIPACKGYNGFPNSLCISVNEVIIHGIPGQQIIKQGDVVSIDTVILKDGFHGDHAYTFVVGESKPEVLNMVKVTKEALFLGIEQAVTGKRVGDIGEAIAAHAQTANGFGIIREFVGHGVGRSMHEEPQIPNYGRKGTGKQLTKNMVVAIEPMVVMGKRDIHLLRDGWSVVASDGSLSAHFEHSVCVKNGRPTVLTDFAPIELAEKSNTELNYL